MLGRNVMPRTALWMQALAGCVAALVLVSTDAYAYAPPFGLFAVDAADIRRAIDRERPTERPAVPLTGLTVPHHLLAADLIARGFWAATGGSYDKIVVLMPDHFRRSRRPFATTTRGFASAFGAVATNVEDTRRLLETAELFEDSSLFEREHALQALLPFIAEFFPGVKIVPVAISIMSRRSDWDAGLKHLEPLITPRTLILQSTDFSHFLPIETAIQRDQEVLNTIAAGDVDVLARLRQPDHMDSIGSQYIHMMLQSKLYGAKPIVIANANSQQYFKERVERSTSYIVQLYCVKPAAGRRCGWTAQGKTFFFGGDVLAGRNFTRHLKDEGTGKAISDTVLAITRGAPMIVNLEGVIADELPDRLANSVMVSQSRVTLDWLTRLNVVGAGLANNHVMDLGADAFEDMKALLDRSKITTLPHGAPKDFGPFRLVALTDLSNAGPVFTDRLTAQEIEQLPVANLPAPLVAFVHWGQDGVRDPSEREAYLAGLLNRQAVSAIIGAHSHVASESITVIGGGETQVIHSLGNFIFDQNGPKASGALLEVTFFEQGTFATRLVPIPNLYDLATQRVP